MPNAAHIHLILNHLPIFGLLIAGGVLVWGLARRHNEVIRTGLGVVVVVAALIGPVAYSGEEAEDLVEEVAPGVHDRIEEHEHAAEPAIWAVAAAGVLALVVLVLDLRGQGPGLRPGAMGVLAVMAVAAMLTARANNLGGEIRHSEIREGGAAIPADPEGREHDSSHDD